MYQIITEFQYLGKIKTATIKFPKKWGKTNKLQTVKRCFNSCGDARKQCWTPGFPEQLPFQSDVQSVNQTVREN